ncbi:MAG: class I SAM-dependent methyltransferase [Acidobacteria bacterium]|nr:class I SAM-dependent methyltransferase [Acidobacteriota bacterium]
MSEAQSFSVKRAEVEFHNFASLGEPERVIAHYAAENVTRGAILRDHASFIGPLSPFLEIGANAGHTSYMLANEFGADGFALDISADALRHGMALQELWGYHRAPVRMAGDALNLPFADGSLRLVVACQMLSQFMDIESVFVEAKRVLAPGGVFLFAEEPLRRRLSLRLYRCPYYNTMKPWERLLHRHGLLGYLVRDVIGAHQEESFGIRQNHSMELADWHRLVRKHFVAHEYEVFVPERGWGERWMKRLAVRLDPYGSEWRAARLMGGTLTAMCRKEGEVSEHPREPFERMLRCPDCLATVRREADDALACTACGYRAALDGGVYNLLRSADRAELYPGDRDDIIDFSLAGHERRLIGRWHELEGEFGNRWRWIGPRAEAALKRVKAGPQRLRIRGSVPEGRTPMSLTVEANGAVVGRWTLDRSGLFVVEADLADAEDYRIAVLAGPEWSAPGDQRIMTVNLSMIRLAPRD